MSKIRIIGSKIELRDTIENDLDDYYRWFTEELEWTKWDAPWEEIDDVFIRKYIEKLSSKINNGFPIIRTRFEIYYESVHIGWVSSYYIKKDRKQRAVGINITEQQFWGNGFGREALTLFIKYLFDNNISTLFCQTWSGNTRMTRLAQSLGFIKIEDTEIVIIKNEKYNHIKYQIGSSKKNKL